MRAVAREVRPPQGRIAAGIAIALTVSRRASTSSVSPKVTSGLRDPITYSRRCDTSSLNDHAPPRWCPPIVPNSLPIPRRAAPLRGQQFGAPGRGGVMSCRAGVTPEKHRAPVHQRARKPPPRPAQKSCRSSIGRSAKNQVLIVRVGNVSVVPAFRGHVGSEAGSPSPLSMPGKRPSRRPPTY